MTAGPLCEGWTRDTGRPWNWTADCGHWSCWAVYANDVLAVPVPPAYRRPTAREITRLVLWAASDRLCKHKATFGLGHLLGEAGWKLRQP